jgi:hypothetical protein
MFCNMCVCFYNTYILIFSVFCLCTFIFVCTRAGLLPPGESPIAVSSNNNNKNNNMSEKHESDLLIVPFNVGVRAWSL